jgi:hypothetical protein
LLRAIALGTLLLGSEADVGCIKLPRRYEHCGESPAAVARKRAGTRGASVRDRHRRIVTASNAVSPFA